MSGATGDLFGDLFGEIAYGRPTQEEQQEEWTKLLLIAMTTHLVANMSWDVDRDETYTAEVALGQADKILEVVAAELERHKAKEG